MLDIYYKRCYNVNVNKINNLRKKWGIYYGKHKNDKQGCY